MKKIIILKESFLSGNNKNFFILNTSKPAFGGSGRTWDIYKIIKINNLDIPLYLDTTYGKYAYFLIKDKWYKINYFDSEKLEKNINYNIISGNKYDEFLNFFKNNNIIIDKNLTIEQSRKILADCLWNYGSEELRDKWNWRLKDKDKEILINFLKR